MANYNVASGDTCSTIVTKSNIHLVQLKANNVNMTCTDLQVGQTLCTKSIFDPICWKSTVVATNQTFCFHWSRQQRYYCWQLKIEPGFILCMYQHVSRWYSLFARLCYSRPVSSSGCYGLYIRLHRSLWGYMFHHCLEIQYICCSNRVRQTYSQRPVYQHNRGRSKGEWTDVGRFVPGIVPSPRQWITMY
jgi:hypothetical protein